MSAKPKEIIDQSSDSDDSLGKHHVKKERDHLEDEHAKAFPMRYSTIPLPGGGEIYLNSFSSFFGFVFLWGFAIWCMVDPDGSYAELNRWKSSVTSKFTWFYIVANPCFTFFIWWLAWRFGDIRLGKKDEKPEFDDVSYFMMLFSAGVGIGLFFYGVSEPLWHQSSNYYAMAGYHSQDEVDQWALMITMFHWGFAAWSPYLVVAISAGLAAYRFDLPMTLRSAFYQVFGAYTWGWIGDVIDGFSIVMTVAGVCTSLGLGAQQLSAGAIRLGWMDDDLTDDETTNKQIIIIWTVTLIATASVVSGIGVGIKLLSQLGFGMGVAILVLSLIMEKTNYLFNVLVQTTGFYFQWNIFQVPFWCDAFGQLKAGEGRNIDGRGAEDWWMDAWTVFYMAWWTSWGAFVGLFLARISRGRTIRSVVLYSFMAPLFFSLLWFCTFGGIGLRQQRQAMELEIIGQDYFGDPAHYRVNGSDFCYNVPQGDVVVNDTVVFTNTLPGITPVCEFDSSDSTQAWFNVMYSFSYPENGFGGFGKFMAGFSMIALTIYFVTSSDSGSLIVDHLASNGHEDHHWLQRVIWAFTEGAVATALLVAGGQEALSALQAGSIVFGLPFNIFLFAMMYNVVKMLNIAEKQDAEGDESNHLPEPELHSFAMPSYGGVFNIVEYIVSIGSVHEDRVSRGMDFPTAFHVREFLIGLAFPFIPIYRILCHLEYSNLSKYLTLGCYTAFHFLWIALMACASINFGFVAFGFTVFFLNGITLTSLRMEVREKFNLDGNILGDFIVSCFLWFQVTSQMIYQLEEVEPVAVERQDAEPLEGEPHFVNPVRMQSDGYIEA